MPGVTVQGVELSREVVELLPWFTNPGATAAAPPVIVADARRYVAADTTQYDVIIADLFHPGEVVVDDGGVAVALSKALPGCKDAGTLPTLSDGPHEVQLFHDGTVVATTKLTSG